MMIELSKPYACTRPTLNSSKYVEFFQQKASILQFHNCTEEILAVFLCLLYTGQVRDEGLGILEILHT
jgi:hypothetical protein